MRLNAERERAQLRAWLQKALRKCEFLPPFPSMGRVVEEGCPPLMPVLFPVTGSASLIGVQMTSETRHSGLHSASGWGPVSLLSTVLVLQTATIHSNKHFPRAYYVPGHRRGSGHSFKGL